jgi:hypothetical protein
VDLQLKWPIWGFFLELMDQCEFFIFQSIQNHQRTDQKTTLKISTQKKI